MDFVNQVLEGDVLARLRELPDEAVHCVVTSPPYWGLRDYGVDGQIGLESTPQDYVTKIVEVFREVRRVLSSDGTLWLNIGDSYAADRGGTHMPAETLAGGVGGHGDEDANRGRNGKVARRDCTRYGLKHKDLVGIPWRLAFGLQADGWWLRSDIIWSKPNPMPESVTDRPTKAHEYVFLLSKSERYYYDSEAIKEPASLSSVERWDQDLESQEGSHRANGGEKTNGTMKRVGGKQRGHGRRHDGFNDRWDSMMKEEQCSIGRNKRTVWTIATATFKEAHFATFPEKLVEPCILAGSPEGGIVLDPFMGSGTTALVALKANRKFVGIELNPQYAEMARSRIAPELSQMKLA